MHKLTVTLRQHTPLIHFQHDQEGATLRASEVKPKLDRFILTKLGGEDGFEAGIRMAKDKGWLVGKGDHPALDYKMRIKANEIQVFLTNRKREYTSNDESKDKKKGKTIIVVRNGDIIGNPDSKNNRYVICENNKKYFAKVRKSDHKVIFDLGTYPCFFANMDSDITNFDEYRKMSFTDEVLSLSIASKYEELIKQIDKNELLCSFFMNHNFGTRQSKGFGSFYIDEEDIHYIEPISRYSFNLPVKGEYYDDDYKTLFEQIELFTKTLRAGINAKCGKNTVFYFKSLAFMYCKDRLKSKWDKKCVKSKFYYSDLRKQQKDYTNDDAHEVLFFDDGDGYDIRDMLGFSTNEEWQSYKDSIEKKVALDKGTHFPKKTDSLPVERMRSPILIKPICSVDDESNISYDIYLIFQDDMVGMDDFKKQLKMCFFSKRNKGNDGYPMRFMINIPKDFSMEDYFDYIFKELKFDISSHVEKQYQNRAEYEILEDIYSQIKNNIQ